MFADDWLIGENFQRLKGYMYKVTITQLFFPCRIVFLVCIQYYLSVYSVRANTWMVPPIQKLRSKLRFREVVLTTNYAVKEQNCSLYLTGRSNRKESPHWSVICLWLEIGNSKPFSVSKFIFFFSRLFQIFFAQFVF